METTKDKFYELVKSGLWGINASQKMFESPVDWETIYIYSRQQALLGTVMDGINSLPENLRPPRVLYLKWCAEVLEIEDENLRLDKEVVNLFQLLESHGVYPVLMKGQGVSRNYPNPLHRTSGDIDIYIGKQDYDKVNNLLSIDGKALEKWSPKHLMFQWHNVVVENHRIMAKLNSPLLNKRLQKLIDDWHNKRDTAKIEIEGYKITLPPLDFDVVFLLLHSVVHLMGFGVGLRQISDWAITLHYRNSEINKEAVKKMLQELGLINSARVFGALAVNYLGLKEEDLIIPYKPSDLKWAKVLLDDIWYNGNFGFSGERIKKRPGGYVKARLYNLYNTARRANGLRKIAPKEALWAPYKRFTHFFISRYDRKPS